MILEIATFTIDPAKGAAFEAAYAEASKIIKAAAGVGRVSLHHCIEQPEQYLLHAEWQSVAHHMEGFRASPAFQEWRRILGPFFLSTPTVVHVQQVG